jgi:hypothetical protein
LKKERKEEKEKTAKTKKELVIQLNFLKYCLPHRIMTQNKLILPELHYLLETKVLTQ